MVDEPEPGQKPSAGKREGVPLAAKNRSRRHRVCGTNPALQPGLTRGQATEDPSCRRIRTGPLSRKRRKRGVLRLLAEVHLAPLGIVMYRLVSASPRHANANCCLRRSWPGGSHSN